MVTAIVRGLRDRLARDPQLEVEIIFPVASEAIATTQDDALRVIPGIAGGEGCSTAGGCATCPFMKMNSLDALFAAIWPAAYAAYGLTRGQIDGFYPYFFLDPTAISWPQIALNLLGLVVAFVAGALLLIALSRVLARQPQNRPDGVPERPA